ncbi:MAG: HAD family phosphatase [Saprospiraceae bacterium]
MKGIIFDMDGTMVDNMMTHHRVWQVKLAELGLELTIQEVMEQIHGVNTEILERLFGDRFSHEDRVRISGEKEAAYRDYFRSRVQLIEGLPTLLEELASAGIPMAIGTAAPPENVDFVLDTLGIRHYFKTVLHSDDVKKGKPDPEIFLKAAERLGVAPADCLVFEDSLTGAKTAANAGMPAIVVTTTHAREEFAHFNHILRFIDDYTHLTLDTLQADWHN